MSSTTGAATCRPDGAKTNPTPSAPRAVARSASSAQVIPQIFTNIVSTLVRVPGRPAPHRLRQGPYSGCSVPSGDQ